MSNKQTKHKRFNFRIYPNQEQQVLLNKTFGCVRFTYNFLLAQAIEAKEQTGKIDINNPASLKEDFPFLKEVDSQSLANAEMDLKQAFKNNKKNRKHFGIPKFKSKKRTKNSYRSCVTNNNIRIINNDIKLPKIGLVKFDNHRQAPDDYILKSATVKKSSTNKYFVSLLYEYESDIKPIELTNSKQVLGLDFSMPQLYVDSNGDYPILGSNKMYKKYIKQLQKEQKKMSKRYEVSKSKGKDLLDSKNYQKQKLKVAKIHEKIANCRKDFLHKETTAITKQYDFVVIEDLSMKGMAKALNFSKSVSDNSWGSFTILLSEKLENKGGKLVKIAKSYPSSKMCSTCGNVKTKLSLSERTYKCEGCDSVIDRDLNAALNIKKEGIRILLT